MSARRLASFRSLAALLVVALFGAAMAQAIVPTRKTINIDGNLSDWDEILTNPTQTTLDGDGSVIPCPFSPDKDCQVQSSGRDMRVFAWTYDSQFLFVYLTRQGSSSNDQTFWFYLDVDTDQLMGTRDSVLRVRFNGSTGLTQNSLFPYLPVDPGGDPMVDGLGSADGYDIVGDCDSTATWTEGVPNGGSADGSAFEERVPWASLGVPSGTGLFFHVGSSNSPNPSNVSQQVDDNMGGLNGGIGSLGFDLVTVRPDHFGTVADGSRVQYAHVITNDGTLTAHFSIKVGSTQGLSVTIYHDRDGDGVGDNVIAVDANGDGDFQDAGDSMDPLYDDDRDGYPGTADLRPTDAMAIVVEIQTRPGMQNQRDVTTVTAWKPGSAIDVSGSAVDTTDIGDMVVLADQAKTSVPNQNVPYPIEICNNGGPNLYDIVVGSSTGSQVDLFSDPECDAVPNDFLARDRDGNGTWDSIPDPPTTDTDSDGMPDTGLLAGGACACYVVQVKMPAGAPDGSQDVTTVTGRANFPVSAADCTLTTTIAPRIQISPNYTFATQTEKVTGADASVYFAHVVRNNWLVAESVSFNMPAPTNTQGWTVQVWSDPNGDGNIADGQVIRSTDPIPPNGGEGHVIVEVVVPPGVPDGTRATTTVTATASSAPGSFGIATDELEVSSIAVFSDPLYTIAQTYFAPCATVYVKGSGLGRQRDDVYDLVWRAPDGTARRFHDPFFPDNFGVAFDTLALGGADAAGTWTVELRKDTLTIDTVEFIVEGNGVVDGLSTDRSAYPLAGQPLQITARLGNGNVRASLPASRCDYVVIDPLGTRWLQSGAPSTFQAYTGVEVTHSTSVPTLAVSDTFPDSFTVPNVTYPIEGVYRVVATWYSACGGILGQASVDFIAGIGEDCGNGVDDDGDGLIDCDDPSCGLDPRCHEVDCVDGIDSDGDTLIDCADPDCADDPACPEVDCSNGLDDDGDTLVDCLDPDCVNDRACHEEDCSDGLDDDGDTLVDCADPDCVTDPACPEVDCTNGLDDDGDTLTDCADSDCAADAACYESDCGDGVDNDGDTLIDCADPDCGGRPPCSPEICDNGLDDDSDGDIDCDDADCIGQPGCEDRDGDTVPDGLDCEPDDASAFAIPPEPFRLFLGKPVPGATSADMWWTDVHAVSGTGTVYDVTTGVITELWADRDFRRATCLSQDVGVELSNDARLLARSRDGYWYLVEAENVCGPSGYGYDSLARARTMPVPTCD